MSLATEIVGREIGPGNDSNHIALSKMASILDRFEREIRSRVERGETHEVISMTLRHRYPGLLGISRRSVRRFCTRRGIHYRSRLSDQELDQIVAARIRSVGHSYGRRTLHGLLSAQGVHVSQRRVGRSLARVAPIPLQIRRHQAHRNLNPPLYTAHFYGEKIHFDQNEKLAMYGVTHVMAVDGYSRKIVGMITIPVKNPIAIYNALMKPLLETEGMWDQVRVDHGTEFVLLVTVQQHLRGRQIRHTHLPVMQSMSRQNHRVERMWPEINARINYPIKRVLIAMETNGEIDMSSNTTKFCVSWITINVIGTAIQNFIQAWNFHRIPGRRGGIPNVLAAATSRTTTLPRAAIPSTSQAIQLLASLGGALTLEREFGRDPLQGCIRLQELRERDFRQRFPNVAILFEDVLHGNPFQFKQALQYFITLTNRFSSLI